MNNLKWIALHRCAKAYHYNSGVFAPNFLENYHWYFSFDRFVCSFNQVLFVSLHISSIHFSLVPLGTDRTTLNTFWIILSSYAKDPTRVAELALFPRSEHLPFVSDELGLFQALAQ